MPSADSTRQHGIKIETPMAGDGSMQDPRRPQVFAELDEAYWHFEGHAGGSAAVWLNTRCSATAAVEQARDGTITGSVVADNSGRS